MTRLRLLGVEITEPKDKQNTRFKNIALFVSRRGEGEKKATTNHIVMCLPPGGKTVCNTLKTGESE